jgi:hypothetical protein
MFDSFDWRIQATFLVFWARLSQEMTFPRSTKMPPLQSRNPPSANTKTSLPWYCELISPRFPAFDEWWVVSRPMLPCRKLHVPLRSRGWPGCVADRRADLIRTYRRLGTFCRIYALIRNFLPLRGDLDLANSTYLTLRITRKGRSSAYSAVRATIVILVNLYLCASDLLGHSISYLHEPPKVNNARVTMVPWH